MAWLVKRPVHPPDSTIMAAFLWLALAVIPVAFTPRQHSSPVSVFSPRVEMADFGASSLPCNALLLRLWYQLVKIGDRSSLCREDGDPPCPSASCWGLSLGVPFSKGLPARPYRRRGWSRCPIPLTGRALDVGFVTKLAWLWAALHLAEVLPPSLPGRACSSLGVLRCLGAPP